MQKRKNKLSTRFDPLPLRVKKIKGTMVTAQREILRQLATNRSLNLLKMLVCNQMGKRIMIMMMIMIIKLMEMNT